MKLLFVGEEAEFCISASLKFYTTSITVISEQVTFL